MWSKLRRAVKHQVCRLYRSTLLRRVVFIGVTGSCGKTTATDLIVAVLSTRFRGRRNPEGFNILYNVVRRVMETSPREDFCAVEIALGEAPIDLPIRMVKPNIGVVTTVGMDHFDKFKSIEAIAAEKGKLVAALPSNGTAVLNADDARVMAMQSNCAAHTFTYGLSSSAMLRAEDIRGDWPDRLSFTAIYERRSVRVETQLCGTHWVPCVLAAFAVGLVMGVPLEAASEAVRNVPPFPGRMSPTTTPEGITFIRDDIKAPLWSIPTSLEFMRRASASRKVFVLGTLSDYQEPLDPTYARAARQAREVSDFVFGVGRWSSRCLRAKNHPDDDTVRSFVTKVHLAKFLRSFLRSGDLVMVKGSLFADELGQLVSKWTMEHSQTIGKAICDHSSTSVAETSTRDNPTQLIVGLGNPGKRFQYTPHNVGLRALDLLAEALTATWSMGEFGALARTQFENKDLLLLKPSSYMNETGPVLARLAKQLCLDHEKILLIHDDISLAPGAIRNKMSGSSGGHKGVQSIIAAFETEDIRRVKIGVGMPSGGTSVTDHVLTAFNGSQCNAFDTACREAGRRALELVNLRSRQ